jgi:predicted dehydrogenase
VMICTPASTHEAVAEQLLAFGYRGPLFVEKPIALRSDAEVFKSWPHPTTMVGYNWRFHRDLQGVAMFAAHERAHIHATCHTDMRTWPGAGYADPVFECSHEIELVCEWLGPVRAVVGGQLRDNGFWVQSQHERGDAVIDIKWAAETARIWRVGRPQGDGWMEIRPSLNAALTLSYYDELRHFINCASREVATCCAFRDGLAVVDVIERARRFVA